MIGIAYYSSIRLPVVSCCRLRSFCLTISLRKLSTAAPVLRDCCAFSTNSTGIQAMAHPHSSVGSPVFGFLPLIFMNHAQSNCRHGLKLSSGQFCLTSIFICLLSLLVFGCDDYVHILHIKCVC